MWKTKLTSHPSTSRPFFPNMSYMARDCGSLRTKHWSNNESQIKMSINNQIIWTTIIVYKYDSKSEFSDFFFFIFVTTILIKFQKYLIHQVFIAHIEKYGAHTRGEKTKQNKKCYNEKNLDFAQNKQKYAFWCRCSYLYVQKVRSSNNVWLRLC